MIHVGWTRPHLPAEVVVGTDHNFCWMFGKEGASGGLLENLLTGFQIKGRKAHQGQGPILRCFILAKYD